MPLMIGEKAFTGCEALTLQVRRGLEGSAVCRRSSSAVSGEGQLKSLESKRSSAVPAGDLLFPRMQKGP